MTHIEPSPSQRSFMPIDPSLEQWATVEIPFPAPLSEVAWLAHPRFWDECIGQIEAVTFEGPVPNGERWTARIRETINLFVPVRAEIGRIHNLLDVRYEYVPGKHARVDYSLVRNEEGVLDVDEGSITVLAVNLGPDQTSLVKVSKRVRVNASSSVAQLFRASPGGLTEMLKFWVREAPNYCGLPSRK